MAALFNMTHGCPYPFLPILDYPYTGGLKESRYCQESFLNTGVVCCLPCPVTNWIYEDNFDTVSVMTKWLSVGGFTCCAFLLLSFLCLPVARTSRHYLTIGLVTGVALINLGFMVSLWAKPHQCYDAITVNDMHTSLACAWSGALLLFGGQSAVMWVFNRSVSLHLQICWSKIPGKKSFYLAQLVGWGVPAIISGVSLGVSGVAFRFGDVCHINHSNSLAAFWGPTLFFAATAAILQFVTLGYVLKVYLRNLWDPKSNSAASSAMRATLPSNNILQTKSVRATYRRVRKVLALQWRGIVVVILVLASAVYFAVIFNIFDQLGTVALQDRSRTREWVICIVLNKGDKSKCLSHAGNFSLNETIVSAVLVLLSVMGYWCLLFLGRLSMFAGWWDLMKKLFASKENFVSVDARRISGSRSYEILSGPPQSYHLTKSAGGGLVATAKSVHLRTVPLDPFSKEVYERDDSPIESYEEPQLPPPTKASELHGLYRSHSQSQVPASNNTQRQRVSFADERNATITEWSRARNNDTLPGETDRVQQQQQTPIIYPIQQVNEYTPRDNNPHTAVIRSASSASNYNHGRSASAASNYNQGRSASALSNHNYGRSNSALGRDWPTPSTRAATNSPGPLRSNSRAGNGSALGNRPNAREWDHANPYSRQ